MSARRWAYRWRRWVLPSSPSRFYAPQVQQPVQQVQPQYQQPPAQVAEAPQAAPVVIEAAQPVIQQPEPVKLTAFQQSVQTRLAKTNQTLPAEWQPLFQREATGDKKAKLLVAAKFLKADGVKGG